MFQPVISKCSGRVVLHPNPPAILRICCKRLSFLAPKEPEDSTRLVARWESKAAHDWMGFGWFVRECGSKLACEMGKERENQLIIRWKWRYPICTHTQVAFLL